MRSLLTLLLVVPVAVADPVDGKIARPDKYSVEMVSTIKKDDKEATVPCKIYVDGDYKRMETTVNGRDFVTIRRTPERVIYVLMMQQKTYMVQPLMDQPDVLRDLNDPTLKIEDQGAETIREQECRKYKITTAERSSVMWVNAQTRLPVRCVVGDSGTTVDWSNYKLGAQPGELFQPPADFKKIEMVGRTR